MPYDDVYSAESVQSWLRLFNYEFVFSTIFGSFCTFAIFRYSKASMESGYRFHLLNICIWTLFCDLNISILTRFYPLTPVNGGCFLGELSKGLMKWVEMGDVLKITGMIYIFILMTNVSTMCNAAIHKYLFVSNLTGEGGYKFPSIHVHLFMVFLQVIWPVFAALAVLKINFQTEAMIKETKSLYPDIFERIKNDSCILVTADTVEFIKNYFLFGIGVFTHITFCMVLTFILLIGCWHKITKVQQGYSISARTLKMQRHLLISLTVQSLFPCFVFLIGTVTFWLQYFIESLHYLTEAIATVFPMHTVANCCIIFATIPAYSRGLWKDLKFLATCGRDPAIGTLVSNISVTNTTEVNPTRVPFFKRILR